jgi:tRNA-modifying protein YgfZ
MNPGWRQFLVSIGGRVEDNLDVEFPSRCPESGSHDRKRFIMDLSRLSVIEVDGADAPEFLNGQFTSDIKLLTDNSFQYSAWCNPKGRVIAVFIIYLKQNSYYILIPDELKDRFIKRLQMYILRSQVSIHDRSEDFACLGVISPDHTAGLPSVPARSGEIMHAQNHSILRIEDAAPLRLLAVGSWTKTMDLWQSLGHDYACAGSGLWHYHDIKAGLPWLSEASSELYLPQELNLDFLNGLSYSKGCFPGQEVIARIHYRGNVKQRLLFSDAPEDAKHPGAGDKLYTENSDTSVGTVITVASSGQGDFGILAVADIDKAGTDLHLAGGRGKPLHFRTQ